MAWIYLAESAESAKPYTPGSDPLPTVKEIASLKRCFCPVWQEVTCLSLPSGMMLQRCTLKNYLHEWTSFLEDSPAKISVWLAAERVLAAHEAACSLKSSDSPGSSSPLSFSLKTYLPLGPVEAKSWGKSWPDSGFIANGMLFQRKKSARPTSASDGSFLLPTPTASDYGTGGNGVRKGKQKPVISLGTMARKNLWPTPVASDWKRNGSPADFTRKSPTLGAVVKLWPTPTASEAGRDGPGRKYGNGSPTLSGQAGGKLNPLWVEWLMGYPAGWTALEDWAMQWFRPKRAKHSKG